MATSPTKRATKSSAAHEALDNDLGKLFHHQLKDTYFAETAITKALPKMIKGAKSKELKSAFESHLKQTHEHVSRLEQIFDMAGWKAEGTPCEAIKGIIKEGDEVAEEFGETEAGDAGLAAAAQAVEHYEITRYGTLKAWARDLGFDEAIELIEQTEDEEVQTDQLLTQLAATLNETAMGARA